MDIQPAVEMLTQQQPGVIPGVRLMVIKMLVHKAEGRARFQLVTLNPNLITAEHILQVIANQEHIAGQITINRVILRDLRDRLQQVRLQVAGVVVLQVPPVLRVHPVLLMVEDLVVIVVVVPDLIADQVVVAVVPDLHIPEEARLAAQEVVEAVEVAVPHQAVDRAEEGNSKVGSTLCFC